MGAIIFDMPVIEGKALLTLALVALLDSMLSVDNALVLAVVVEHLPVHQRARALRYGILGAYAMRGFSIFSIAYLVHFWPLKLAGSLYLLWLGGSHLLAREESGDTGTPKRPAGFWRTVIQVEWLDLTFSLDNLIATVALANGNVVITIAGVFISILAMRFVASLFLRLVDRFPVLRQTAYVLVVFIGLKLFHLDKHKRRSVVRNEIDLTALTAKLPRDNLHTARAKRTRGEFLAGIAQLPPNAGSSFHETSLIAS